MAQYERRDKRTVRHEYVLPNPANWVEVRKALDSASGDYTDAFPRIADDSIWVTHADDEIIIYWEEESNA